MKKNIWILNHYAGTANDTNALRHFYFAKHLIEQGYQVTIFAASTIHNTKINRILKKEAYIIDRTTEVPFVYIKTRNYEGNGIKRVLNMFDYYFGVLKVTKKFNRPDLVWGSSVHPLACVAAIQLAHQYKCKNICEIRDLWPESIVAYKNVSRKNPIIQVLYQLEYWIYKNANNLVFTMEGGWDYVRQRGWERDVKQGKVYHINNGVDLESFIYNQKNHQISDHDLENTETFKVIYTGSIRKSNNLGILIEAAEKIKKLSSNIVFLVYGQGDELEFLKKEVKNRKIENIIFNGSIHKKYIPYILSKSDVNILDIYDSSIFQYGVSPNKLFDYLAGGKRILSGLICKYDILKKYNCGITLGNINANELANKIIFFYNMPKEQREKMENNAREASLEFDYCRLTEKVIEIIEKQ